MCGAEIAQSVFVLACRLHTFLVNSLHVLPSSSGSSPRLRVSGGLSINAHGALSLMSVRIRVNVNSESTPTVTTQTLKSFINDVLLKHVCTKRRQKTRTTKLLALQASRSHVLTQIERWSFDDQVVDKGD